MRGDSFPAMDWADPEVREEIARAAYYRERSEDALIDQEHDPDGEAQYFCLRWEQLSSFAQRPYRITVDVALDQVRRVLAA